uniref:Uncharacterized protein n=1 Tax=Glossina austeni TaxID=7395 RepID=A0A1A9UVZ2_GLOAU
MSILQNSDSQTSSPLHSPRATIVGKWAISSLLAACVPLLDCLMLGLRYSNKQSDAGSYTSPNLMKNFFGVFGAYKWQKYSNLSAYMVQLFIIAAMCNITPVTMKRTIHLMAMRELRKSTRLAASANYLHFLLSKCQFNPNFSLATLDLLFLLKEMGI